MIFEKIITIIESKHKDSIKKLRKESHWEGNITNWLGQQEMKFLKERLMPFL
ncbi:hypothetical protein ADICYQ_1243 [Cyclobacterium qasimii M12-11B]|uniref:Uncharacterized protein n=1 Tax=Cyclobacterium qasimii M12-11B TaxID=641524 RepID=S7VJY3_9BACT|nr:hypothetical protein ADICYQ_1243 [Cyclobacterium qasimii M12-11B]